MTRPKMTMGDDASLARTAAIAKKELDRMADEVIDTKTGEILPASSIKRDALKEMGDLLTDPEKLAAIRAAGGIEAPATKSRLKKKPRYSFIFRSRDADQKKYTKILLYGGPGTGKTSAAISTTQIEAMRPMFFVDVDRGTLQAPSTDDVTYIDNITVFRQVVNLARAISKGELDARTVVIDSLSFLYRFQLNSQTRKGGPSIKRWMEGVPAQQDYALGHTRAHAALLELTKTPVHIICTCHAREYVDSVGRRQVRPAMPGVLSGDILGYFDIVGYLYSRAVGKRVKHYVQFHPYGNIQAKSRSDVAFTPMLPASVEVTGRSVIQVIYDACISSSKVKIEGATLRKDDDIEDPEEEEGVR